MKTNLSLLSICLVSFVATADSNIKPPPGPYIAQNIAIKLQQALVKTNNLNLNSYPKLEAKKELRVIPQTLLQKQVVSKKLKKVDTNQNYPSLNQKSSDQSITIKNNTVISNQSTSDDTSNVKNFWDVDPKFLQDESKDSNQPINKFLEYPPL